MTEHNIHNYYEHLVFQIILELADKPEIDSYVEDVACVALNKLPPRYIRYDIDMVFYLNDKERETMINQVEYAVKYAIDYVSSHKQSVA